jgi:hypothetical protein
MNVVNGKYSVMRGMITFQRDRGAIEFNPSICLIKGKEHVARVFFHTDLQQYVMQHADGYCIRMEGLIAIGALISNFQLIYHRMEDVMQYEIDEINPPGKEPDQILMSIKTFANLKNEIEHTHQPEESIWRYNGRKISIISEAAEHACALNRLMDNTCGVCGKQVTP